MIIYLAQAESMRQAQDASRNDRVPSGAEAQPIFVAVAERLKSCPVTKPGHFVAFCNVPEQIG